MLDQPLYAGSRLSVGQCLLMVMSFALGNNLSGAAISNLLTLLAAILPYNSQLPKTKWLFDKYFQAFKNNVQYKLYCPTCESLLSGIEGTMCTICKATYDQAKHLKDGYFFIYLPIEKQIRDLFSKCSGSVNLNYRFSRVKECPTSIEDIFDGQIYKTMANGTLDSDPNALSITFNCDGVPIFKSSNFGIWPLQGIINELPPKERYENILLIGLWFGTGKPTMTTFLHPFTEELRRLSTIGMKWVNAGISVCSRVFACICSCDSVARCVLQNIHQFNGLNGCSWCIHPGKSIAKGGGHCRVYVEGDDGHDLRTHKATKQHGREAHQNKEPVCGVKGPTKFSELISFDIVRGFVVDNLHCIDLGVTRQLGHLWFDSCNHDQAWYLGPHTAIIDARLQRVMPPQEVTRLPRSISQRAHWKGSEWHWWLLLYAPVVLGGLLPTPYFRHLLLLVEGVYLLSKSSITRHEINKADHCLAEFVRNFHLLYGEENTTYNVHQLTHLAQTVIDWGPLWCYSAYIFEGFNMVLLRLFHGTQAVPNQIASSFLLYRAMTRLCKTEANDPSASVVLSFMTEQLKGQRQAKKATKINTVTYIGGSYSRQLSIEELYVAEEFFGRNDIIDDAEFFTKAIVDGRVLHCVNYRRKSRRKNSIVEINNKIIELIVFAIIRFNDASQCSIAFGREVQVQNAITHTGPRCGVLCSHVKRIAQTCSVLKAVELTNIGKLAVIEGVDNKDFCIKLPNNCERD